MGSETTLRSTHKKLKPMEIVLNVFGPETSLNQKISVEPETDSLGDVLRALSERTPGPWNRLLRPDLTLEKGCVILVNGRNILSLENLETKIHEGDEITLTVLVTGG